jgi:hypothetical protein
VWWMRGNGRADPNDIFVIEMLALQIAPNELSL